MGLFRKKRDEESAQLTALRSEVRSLHARLDEAEIHKVRLEARIAEGEAAKGELAERVGSIDTLSRQLSNQAGSVVTLTTQVQQLAEQVARPPDPPPPPPPPPDKSVVDRRVDGIERRLADLDVVNERLDALSAAITRQAQEALASAGGVDPGHFGDMANRLEDLSVAVATHTTQLAATKERVDAIEPVGERDDDTREVVDEMRRQLGQMAERMTSLDHRLTNVSTELANQLTELSRDIDNLTDRPPSPSPSPLPPPPMSGEPQAIEHLDTDELELRLAEKFDMAIDDVRESQARLAAEQARYEIKFREDLADLAERLRRPRPH